MRVERLTESKPRLIGLEPDQAEQLRRLGQLLASDRKWWGEPDDSDVTVRTVVRCDQQPAPGQYRVTVAEAVGAIGLRDVQLIVEPKIPMAHFLYLLSESGSAPRVAQQRAMLDTDDGFFVLAARWFLEAVESVLRHDLIRDYESVCEDTAFARGRVHAVPTARAAMTGRVAIRCTYSSFSEDNALNRVLRAASERLMGSTALPPSVRRRARRAHIRLDGAGPLRTTDVLVRTDARTLYYKDSLALGLTILAGWGVSPRVGTLVGSTFLFRTPEAIEEGVRATLRRRLGERWKVRKKGRTLVGSDRVLNPDLVFGDDLAIGDVKYRVSNGEIKRAHLSQVTTFAAGYRAKKASVVAFGSVSAGEHVEVGDISVDVFNWNTAEPDPEVAAVALASSIEQWLHEGK